jgi:hypothetical protein
MTRRTGKLALLAVPLLVFTSAEDQTVTLTGSAVRPDKVTTAATGTGEFAWGDDGGVEFTIRVKGLSSQPTAVHIHGPAKVDDTAPVFETLDMTDSLTTGTIAKGKTDETLLGKLKREALKAMLDEGLAYVDIHTKNHPDGEIRGHFKDK